tara:strand:- start:1728 stop:2117 length:390 start_codon:yes stop_codon:yes gene_type:complete
MVREARLKFTRELPGTLTVRSIDEAGIRINDELWSGSVAMTPTEVLGEWTSAPIAELVAGDFDELLEHAPELVLIGTGAQSQFAPRELMFAFARRGIGLEVMDTAAAARTFNVLAGEGRRVAAVLYPGR